MIHMGFSGAVAFLLIRVFEVVPKVRMTKEIYVTCVIPIGAFFAASLWFGNTTYLFISVAFIQMLKALMTVATFLMAVICRTDTVRCDLFLNMILINFGVLISSYGEIHFNVVGTVFQVTGIIAEALRFLFLSIPWYLLEMSAMDISKIQLGVWTFLSIALCALILNFVTFLVIGRTGAVTIRVAGVLKDWFLIALSTVIFPESAISKLNIIGYAIALCEVIMYNWLKAKDVCSAQTTSNVAVDLNVQITQTSGRESRFSNMDDGRDETQNLSPGRSKRADSDAEVVSDEETPLVPTAKGLLSRVKPSS